MFTKKPFDFKLFVPILVLYSFGLITVASVYPENLINHIVYLLIGLVLFFLFFLIDKDLIFPFAGYFYIVTGLSLLLPFFIGTISRGSVRWIPVGGLTIQPSEIIKPFLALFSAYYWGKFASFKFKLSLKYFLFITPVILLVYLQPDLGSTLVIVVGVIIAVLLSGMKMKNMIILALIGFILSLVMWLSLKDYQKMRIVHFMNPYSDPLGAGYNAIQAKIAVGSGGLLGKGLGRGTQSHLSFLPERHTDFAFASLSEEIGFLGSIAVLVSYLLLFLQIVLIAENTNIKHDRILVLAILSMMFFQTFVNIGMNIGLMPITGVTLPLISYGGSSIIATMIGLGMIANIAGGLRNQRFIRIN